MQRQVIVAVGICLFGAYPLSPVGAEPNKSEVAASLDETQTLLDRWGNERSLKDLAGNAPAVFGFIDAYRTATDSMFGQMTKLEEKYRSNGVRFFAVYAEPTVDLAQATAHAADMRMSWHVLFDDDGRFASQLSVNKIPEFLFVDKDRKVLYRGPLGRATLGDENEEPATGLCEALALWQRGEPVVVEVPTESTRSIAQRERRPVRYRSFTDHISPILQQHCQGCHHANGMAPFSLVMFNEVIAKADDIERVLRTNQMPPWHADDRFGVFVNDSGLNGPERNIFFDWLESGRDAGDLARWTRNYKVPSLPRLDKTDAVIVPPGTTQVITAPESLFSYAAVPASATASVFQQERWLQAIECRSRKWNGYRHFRVFLLPPDVELVPQNLGSALAVFTGTGLNPITRFPGRMALRLPKGTQLYYQFIRDNAAAKNPLPSIAFSFASGPRPEEVRVLPLMASEDRLRAGVPYGRGTADAIVAIDGSLVGCETQMQGRGKELTLSLTGVEEQSEARLLSNPRHDASWQGSYWWSEPYRVGRGASLELAGYWDNSGFDPHASDSSKEVAIGLGPNMATLACWLYVASRRETAPEGSWVLNPDESATDEATLLIERDAEWQLTGKFAESAKWQSSKGDAEQLGRLTIGESNPEQAWGLQLISPTMAIESDHRYTLRFQANAEKPRTIFCVLRQAKAPYENLSRYFSVPLSDEKNDYFIDLSTNKGSEEAIIAFSVGSDATAMELGSITLQNAGPAEANPFQTRSKRTGSIIAFPFGQETNAFRIEQSTDSSGDTTAASVWTGEHLLKKGDRFRVSFRARSPRPREMTVTVSNLDPPQDNVGLFRKVPLYRRWERFDIEGSATKDARTTILFFVGGSAASIDLADVEFTKLDNAD